MNSHSRLARTLVFAVVATACFVAGLLTRVAATHFADSPGPPPAIRADGAPPLIGWPLLRVFAWP